MDCRENGYDKRNAGVGDYSRFLLWWTCNNAIKKVVMSSDFLRYPGYLKKYLTERLGKEFNDEHGFYNIIGLPAGMELAPLGKEAIETTEFIVNKKLIAVAVAKEDWDGIKVPPGFITDLNYLPLTKIPKG